MSRGRGRGRRPRAGRGSGRARRTLAVLGGVALAALGVQLVPATTADEGPFVAPALWTEGRVRVEVLNTGGVSGMARSATGVLRASGFDVVSYGNAATFDTSRPSAVIDRVGRTDIAQAVAKALGIDNVQSDPDPNLFVDVSVLLGREWTEPEGSWVDEESGVRWSWDPRSWFGR